MNNSLKYGIILETWINDDFADGTLYDGILSDFFNDYPTKEHYTNAKAEIIAAIRELKIKIDAEDVYTLIGKKLKDLYNEPNYDANTLPYSATSSTSTTSNDFDDGNLDHCVVHRSGEYDERFAELQPFRLQLPCCGQPMCFYCFFRAFKDDIFFCPQHCEPQTYTLQDVMDMVTYKSSNLMQSIASTHAAIKAMYPPDRSQPAVNSLQFINDTSELFANYFPDHPGSDATEEGVDEESYISIGTSQVILNTDARIYHQGAYYTHNGEIPVCGAVAFSSPPVPSEKLQILINIFKLIHFCGEGSRVPYGLFEGMPIPYVNLNVERVDNRFVISLSLDQAPQVNGGSVIGATPETVFLNVFDP